MTEELISVVSRIQGLDVIARTTVMAYRDTTKSVTEIGRELNVGTVLEGSVRAERALQLNPELLEAHASLGYVALNADWDWRTAERENVGLGDQA